MTRNAEVIRHLLLLKECAIKSHNDTGIININIDSFNFVIDMAIQALEQEPCDTCEVGNPCLYCKHKFEPQESEDKE